MKRFEDWVKEHKDLEIVKKGDNVNVLICHFCNLVLLPSAAKKPCDCIREDLASARHGSLKRMA